MCLAVPMKVLEHEGDSGLVEVGGTQKKVMLTLVPEVKIGQWVIVHAGYALEILDEEEAQRTLDLFRQLGELDELNRESDA